MTGIQKMIKGMREGGWDDVKIWLHRRFMAHHFHPDNQPDPCQWCGGRDDVLYLVPGVYSFGRMEWICPDCAVEKYGDRIEVEMEEFREFR
jgi:hypothetical protein